MKRKYNIGHKLVAAIAVMAMVITLIPSNISKVHAADKIDISGAEVTYVESHQYTGSEIEPEVSVLLNGEELTSGYDVEYISNVNPGYGTILISGTGNYTGVITRTFRIISSEGVASNEISSPTYNIQDEVIYTTWDTIYFGEYPQSEVTPEDEAYASLQAATGWNEKDDVTIDGVKYHRINQETARDPVVGSVLEQFYPWEEETAYHYFRYEPILWRVLSVEGDYALLLSDEVLDTQSYCEGQYWTHTQYEISKLRSWLNGYSSSENSDGIDFTSDNFIDRAFTDEEQANIKPAEVIDELDLKDNIFLLSVSDMANEAYGLNSSNARTANNSAYAWAMGGWYTHGSNYWLFRRFSQASIEAGGKDEVASMPVVSGGSIDSTSYSPADYQGVRPAVYINWKEADWTYVKACKSNQEKSPDYELNPEVYLDKYEYAYTGQQITPGVTASSKGKTLSKGTDYDVSYGENVNAGTGTVTVTFKGDYTGTVTKVFKIKGIDIATLDMSLAYTNTEYTGKAKRPIITIDGLTKDTDFTSSYYFNRDIGIAYAVATGMGAYSGAQQKTFIIRHTAVEITEKGVDSKGRPTFTYQGNEYADYYDIYRAESEDGPFEIVTESSRSNSYTDFNAIPGRTYYYRVVVTEVNDHTYDSDYTQVSITCKSKVTTPHTIYESYDPELNSSILRWNNVKSADGYHVYRADAEDGEYILIDSTTDTEYCDASAEGGKTYYYKIQAYCALDSSLNADFTDVVSITYPSVQTSTQLSTVTGLKATNVASSGKPKLTWKAVTGADGYEVYRATSKSGTYTKKATVTGTSYTNTSAVAGNTYYYKVKAIDKDNASANSKLSAAVSRTCDLARVTGVKATNVASSGKPKLTWTAVKSANKYEVYRATSKSGTYKKIGSTTKKSYTDSKATAEKTYYYKVKAIYTKKNSGKWCA